MNVCKLTCGHSVEVAVPYDRWVQEEYCPEHRDWMLVVGSWTETWHSRCSTCSYAKSHGKARVYAERAAAAHHATRPSHKVYVAWYSDAPAEVRGEILREPVVPDPSLFDPPPF